MLGNLLDENERVKRWPAKQKFKIQVVEYIYEKFEDDIIYTEKEVNEIIEKWHTFGDYFMIRRGMIDYKLLGRTRNGSEYWKIKTK